MRAPLRASLRQIEQLVAQKAGWVRQKQAYAAAHPAAAPHRFLPGEKFWFLGKEYLLEVVDRLTTETQRHREFIKELVPGLDLNSHLSLQTVTEETEMPRALTKVFSVPLCLCGLRLSDLEERFFLERQALPGAAAAFKAWYRAQARALVEERVRQYAARYGFSYRQVRITSARTRWGSCSAKGTLCFTWRLVMAPPECIDYVVVHELAHLRVANHSPAFWREVGAILPDYKARRKWLRVNGRSLTLE